MYIDDHGYNNAHLMGEYATHPIAPILACPALLSIQAYALFLLFISPGNTWFSRNKPA